MLFKSMRIIGLLTTFFTFLNAGVGYGFSASKVHFEFTDNGRYRVMVTYTVPELQEVREAMVEFSRRQEAEKFYWQLVRGGEFYPTDARSVRFPQKPLQPMPW